MDEDRKHTKTSRNSNPDALPPRFVSKVIPVLSGLKRGTRPLFASLEPTQAAITARVRILTDIVIQHTHLKKLHKLVFYSFGGV